MRKSVAIISGVIVLAGVAGWVTLPNDAPSVERDTATEPVAEPDAHQGATTEDRTGPEPATAETELFARRLPVVPDSRGSTGDDAPSTDERDVTADNIDALVSDHFEHALNGNMASAYFVMRSRRTCDSVASTPEEHQRSISRVKYRAQQMRERGYDFQNNRGYDHPWNIVDDDAANVANLENWYSACERLRRIYSPDLRRELELLARKGHVMARYLYAMWPEDTLHAEVAFDQQYSWEEMARQFSRANLESGEVAGLLAFGQSYLTGMFTARNHDMALGFGLAAVHCGFETLSINSFLADNIERLTGSEDPANRQRLEFIMTMSDNVGRFCSL